jgi:hypothetical protein
VLDGELDWVRVARQRPSIYTIAGARPAASSAADAGADRVRAHAAYVAGNLAEAGRALGAAAPQGAVETTILAEALAEAGDQAAIPRIQALRAIDVVEAEAATARLALRLGRPELARDALVSAFTRYRTDPWPGQLAMAHALELAQELSKAQPNAAPALFEALSQPFAVAAVEEPRRLVRLALASQLGDRYCRDALAPFEPHVPWRADVLRYRASCYQRTGDARARQAQADLEVFLRDEGRSR